MDFSIGNVVIGTMCTLWPISIIMQSATRRRRNKLSTVHGILHNYGKHYASYIPALKQNLKSKGGPELQLPLRTAVNSMCLVRNEYPVSRPLTKCDSSPKNILAA